MYFDAKFGLGKMGSRALAPGYFNKMVVQKATKKVLFLVARPLRGGRW